jgi:glycosyltransferase involved in cell wall biosynthesis
MRILKVTQAYFPYLEKGGPATKVRALAEGLAARGHTVTVLTSAYAPTPEYQTRTIQGVEVTYLRALLSDRALTVNSGLISFCRRRLREFDVVHIYGLYDLLGPTVAFFCRKHRLPYVLEPMGMYRPIVRSITKKRVYHWLLGGSLVQAARRLIATSQLEEKELHDEGIAPGRVVVRRNGVDLNEFLDLPLPGGFRGELGIQNGRPLVLFLGRISKKKGLDILLRAFAKLRARAHLAVVGPDDGDGTVAEIQRLRSELKLENEVTVLHARYGRQKLQAMVDADLFVLPSQNENFGNAVAEAIACGTPVLVTDHCGIAPLVDEKAGLVVPYGAEALHAGLARILEDEPLRERLRTGCRQTAATLGWEEPIQQMESIYNQIAREARAA